jgi:hypothetical protein
MHPSIFTLGTPVETYDVLYGIFTYVLGLGLYLSWASLAFIDMAEGKQGRGLLWGIAVLVVPVMGAALYLLTGDDAAAQKSRRVIVISGLVVWGIALAYGLPKIWGPLGPKAL